MILLSWDDVSDIPILISGGFPAYPGSSDLYRQCTPQSGQVGEPSPGSSLHARAPARSAHMRGVAAGRSAERSGAATGGGGPAGLPRPVALIPTSQARQSLSSASAFRFT